MSKTKHKTPSRTRYEASHPTVSVRVPAEIYHRLQVAKDAEGKSFGYILEAGLGLLEPQIEEKASIRKRALAEGRKKGYAQAERLYKVTYACHVCGELTAVTGDDAKKEIREFMEKEQWGHGSCYDKSK